jgi:hypothetical protein
VREAAQLALEKAAHATKIEVPSAPPATFVAPAGKTAAARTQEPADADAAHTILLKARRVDTIANRRHAGSLVARVPVRMHFSIATLNAWSPERPFECPALSSRSRWLLRARCRLDAQASFGRKGLVALLVIAGTTATLVFAVHARLRLVARKAHSIAIPRTRAAKRMPGNTDRATMDQRRAKALLRQVGRRHDPEWPPIAHECATGDCSAPALFEAYIYDGVDDEPVRAEYCLDCADTLRRGGEDVRPLTADLSSRRDLPSERDVHAWVDEHVAAPARYLAHTLVSSLPRVRDDAEVERLRDDDAKLAMAVRYVLHDHPGSCSCYGCTTARHYGQVT